MTVQVATNSATVLLSFVICEDASVDFCMYKNPYNTIILVIAVSCQRIGFVISQNTSNTLSRVRLEDLESKKSDLSIF